MNQYLYKIFKFKGYSHFDNKKQFINWLSYIRNPENISTHGFYPFIHFTIKTWKYDNDKLDTKEKKREINYSSHIDRYIYEYYNNKLCNKYNLYAKKFGINKCAVAYRNNLHKNNITIARDAFSFLSKCDDSFILVSDFSKYFDLIDHQYLKEQLMEVLQVSFLSDDWYKVFRSVTKYSYIDLEQIRVHKKLTLKETRKLPRICDARELHELKQYIQTNKEKYGIPQGSSISSTLSNVNLVKYDIAINNFVTTHNGLYRRYCDDSLIIIPMNCKDDFLSMYTALNNSIPGLKVNKDKIKEFFLRNGEILDNEMRKTSLDYLGFSYDGKIIKIREKTITAFYLKAYRAIKGLNRLSLKYNRKTYRKQFYKSFTHLGKHKSKNNRGNFLSYIDKCSRIMKSTIIKEQVKKHWTKFNSQLVNPKKKT